jgi:hypothetical protein
MSLLALGMAKELYSSNGTSDGPQFRQEVDGQHLPEVGYHLRRDRRGQGFAAEAARACRDRGFVQRKADFLISWIRPENLPARRVAHRERMSVWKKWPGRDSCTACTLAVPGMRRPQSLNPLSFGAKRGICYFRAGSRKQIPHAGTSGNDDPQKFGS